MPSSSWPFIIESFTKALGLFSVRFLWWLQVPLDLVLVVSCPPLQYITVTRCGIHSRLGVLH
jgi:hypothetical protein